MKRKEAMSLALQKLIKTRHDKETKLFQDLIEIDFNLRLIKLLNLPTTLT